LFHDCISTNKDVNEPVSTENGKQRNEVWCHVRENIFPSLVSMEDGGVGKCGW
jgi:hypothetical protein